MEGVAFARQVRVDGRDLPLRGLGLLRYMVFIKAYVAALYLPEAVGAEDALSEVPRHLEIEYFHAIAASDFAKATTAAIERNTSLMTFRRLEPTITSFVRSLNSLSSSGSEKRLPSAAWNEARTTMSRVNQ